MVFIKKKYLSIVRMTTIQIFKISHNIRK